MKWGPWITRKQVVYPNIGDYIQYEWHNTLLQRKGRYEGIVTSSNKARRRVGLAPKPVPGGSPGWMTRWRKLIQGIEGPIRVAEMEKEDA